MEDLDMKELDNLIESENLNVNYDIEDDFFTLIDEEGNYKYVYNKGTLYEIIEHKDFGESADYIEQTIKFGDEIHFTYLFYNGGTCFTEMLEEGLNKIEK